MEPMVAFGAGATSGQESARSRLMCGQDVLKSSAWMGTSGAQDLPEVGSSMSTMAGLATSSTAMDKRLRCSTLRPLSDGEPINRSLRGINSTSSIICMREHLLAIQWIDLHMGRTLQIYTSHRMSQSL